MGLSASAASEGTKGFYWGREFDARVRDLFEKKDFPTHRDLTMAMPLYTAWCTELAMGPSFSEPRARLDWHRSQCHVELASEMLARYEAQRDAAILFRDCCFAIQEDRAALCDAPAAGTRQSKRKRDKTGETSETGETTPAPPGEVRIIYYAGSAVALADRQSVTISTTAANKLLGFYAAQPGEEAEDGQDFTFPMSKQAALQLQQFCEWHENAGFPLVEVDGEMELLVPMFPAFYRMGVLAMLEAVDKAELPNYIGERLMDCLVDAFRCLVERVEYEDKHEWVFKNKNLMSDFRQFLFNSPLAEDEDEDEPKLAVGTVLVPQVSQDVWTTLFQRLFDNYAVETSSPETGRLQGVYHVRHLMKFMYDFFKASSSDKAGPWHGLHDVFDKSYRAANSQYWQDLCSYMGARRRLAIPGHSSWRATFYTTASMWCELDDWEGHYSGTRGDIRYWFTQLELRTDNGFCGIADVRNAEAFKAFKLRCHHELHARLSKKDAWLQLVDGPEKKAPQARLNLLIEAREDERLRTAEFFWPDYEPRVLCKGYAEATKLFDDAFVEILRQLVEDRRQPPLKRRYDEFMEFDKNLVRDAMGAGVDPNGTMLVPLHYLNEIFEAEEAEEEEEGFYRLTYFQVWGMWFSQRAIEHTTLHIKNNDKEQESFSLLPSESFCHEMRLGLDLLRAGASPDVTVPWSDVPFMHFFARDSIDYKETIGVRVLGPLVDLMARAGGARVLEARDGWGFTPLQAACADFASTHGPWQQRDDTLIRVLLGAGANPDAVAEYTDDDRATVDEPFNEEEKICGFWFQRGRAHGMNCLEVARRTAEVTAREEEPVAHENSQESKDEFVNDIVEEVRKAFLDKCGRVPGEEAPSA
jgi:hypothetical protein